MRPDDLAAVAAAVAVEMKASIAPIVARLDALESSIDARVAVISAEAGIMLHRELATIRERLSVVETRPPQPGPAGKDGEPGPPGPPGDAGASIQYRDTFKDSETYAVGDFVTHDGSIWHCNTPTTGVWPGSGSKAWTLACKRGRDAKGAR